MLSNNFTGLLQNGNDDFDPYSFGVSRTHELPMGLMWLYENHARNNSQLIWETMELMFQGGQKGGRDWTKFFVKGVFVKAVEPCRYALHNISGFSLPQCDVRSLLIGAAAQISEFGTILEAVRSS